jgi:hypothetical protein
VFIEIVCTAAAVRIRRKFRNPAPSRFRADLPPTFEAILVRALSREPAERPSMGELGDAFTELLSTPEAPPETLEPPHDIGDVPTTLMAWPPGRRE